MLCGCSLLVFHGCLLRLLCCSNTCISHCCMPSAISCFCFRKPHLRNTCAIPTRVSPSRALTLSNARGGGRRFFYSPASILVPARVHLVPFPRQPVLFVLVELEELQLCPRCSVPVLLQLICGCVRGGITLLPFWIEVLHPGAIIAEVVICSEELY